MERGKGIAGRRLGAVRAIRLARALGRAVTVVAAAGPAYTLLAA